MPQHSTHTQTLMLTLIHTSSIDNHYVFILSMLLYGCANSVSTTIGWPFQEAVIIIIAWLAIKTILFAAGFYIHKGPWQHHYKHAAR